MTTCRDCGLVFDAAPRDRQVPRRRRADSEVEAEVEAEVDASAKRTDWRLALAASAPVLFVVVLLIAKTAENRRARDGGDDVAERTWMRRAIQRELAAHGARDCDALESYFEREPICPYGGNTELLRTTLAMLDTTTTLTEVSSDFACTAVRFLVARTVSELKCIDP